MKASQTGNSHCVDLLRSAKRLLLPHGYCDFVYSSTDLRGSPDKPDGETILNVLRCAVHINSGRIIYNFAFVALCGALQTHFHRRGRNGKRHLQRRFLRKRGAAGKCCWSAPSQSKPNGFARFPLLSLRDIFPRSGGSLSSKGEPRALPETFSLHLIL